MIRRGSGDNENICAHELQAVSQKGLFLTFIDGIRLFFILWDYEEGRSARTRLKRHYHLLYFDYFLRDHLSKRLIQGHFQFFKLSALDARLARVPMLDGSHSWTTWRWSNLVAAQVNGRKVESLSFLLEISLNTISFFLCFRCYSDSSLFSINRNVIEDAIEWTKQDTEEMFSF